MAAASTIEGSTDRRRNRRDRKDGPVYLSDSSGWGDLSVVTILNRSTRGLAVFSETPFTIRTVVDLEVFDAPSLATSRLQIVRGTIQNVHPHLRGGYRMPVRIQGSKRVVSKKGTSSAPINRSIPTPIRPTLKSTQPTMKFSRRTSHRMRNTFIPLVAIVCVAVFLLNWNDANVIRGYEFGSAAYYQSPTVAAEALTPPPLPHEERDSSGRVSVEEASLFESSLFEHRSAAWGPRHEETTPEPVDDANQESGLDMPLASETLVPRLDVAPLRRGLESGVRNRWDDFSLSDGATSSTETVRHATLLDISIPESLLDESLAIYMDTNTFTLHVIQKGEILWQFPVGAGTGSSTPNGSFSLGTKLIDPTW